MHTRTFLCVVALLISTIEPLTHPFELDENSKPSYANSNDGFGPIEYTDQHTTASLVSEGREATLTMPGGHDNNHPLPLVIALHGYSSSGSFNAWWMSIYDSVHENEHLLLTPDGTLNWIAMRYWNATEACCNLFGSSVDDVVFLEGLISEAVANYGADPDGVILIGHSNGGFMTHRMACDRGNLIESIISLNGATWNDFTNDCPDTGRPNILNVHATLDGVIQYDGGTLNGAQYPSAPQSTSFWAARSGCDSSWTNLGTIDLTSSDGVAETDNLEHLNCADGNRVSHWRINNGSHAPSLNAPDWADQSLAWGLADFVRDSDGDGYRDDVDVFIYNPYEWADADGDLVGDNADQCDQDPNGWDDSDEDGVCVPDDLFPDDSNEWSDADGDGIGDRGDPDDDNDGWSDTNESVNCGENNDPLNSADTPTDTDGDNICDGMDDDDDNDGYLDTNDWAPTDPNEWLDTDGDGTGNNADFDDDGDAWTDIRETDCGYDPLSSSSTPHDFDSDNECDKLDYDDDNDGYLDAEDWAPFNPSEWFDTDGDGIGNNADWDDDGDWVHDYDDDFPLDGSEQWDLDRDGIGDNADTDDDGDGWSDTVESDCAAAGGEGDPNNANVRPVDNETDIGLDGIYGTDDDFLYGDGICNALDTDWDNDGTVNEYDAFPWDPTEQFDADGDGVGDNADIFPEDPNESIDSDGDGVGDNADFYPFDESRWVEESSKIIILFPIGILLILGYTISRRRIKE
jgi:poly(3-hydroxybutyrate) depolymerase